MVVLTTNKMIFVFLSEDSCFALGFDAKKIAEYYGQAPLKYCAVQSFVYDKTRATFTHSVLSWNQKNYRGQYPYELSAGYHSLFADNNTDSE